MNGRTGRAKSAGLYLVILLAWSLLFAALVLSSWGSLVGAFRHSSLLGISLGLLLTGIGYFWMNGIKDLAYTLCWHLWLERRLSLPLRRADRRAPFVVLIYCTRNDFNPDALFASMQQRYPNYAVAILDDSDHPRH